MFDRTAIYSRFEKGYKVHSSVEMVRLLGVKSSTVSQWKTGKRQVPWERLKALVNQEGLSWDWIIDGKKPYRKNVSTMTLNRKAITDRFVAILSQVSQARMAELLDISPVSVHKMVSGKMFVPWDKLRFIVENSHVTWHWLIEGND
ncbi:MAG: helix-turn-helix domain-containing protein [Planctomycetes bacterium]|nr:helix-turn-helix domain-containing protein [Planctomycetota bacterium]